MRNNRAKLIVLIVPGSVSDEIPYVPFEYLFLATFLEKNGYKVMILDLRVEPDWELKLSKVLDEVLWVGLTVITGPKILQALDISKRIKKMRRELPVVWGGWHPTFAPEHVVAEPDIDYVVAGIGELKVLELSEYIMNGQTGPLSCRGILHKNGATSYEVIREQFQWLAELPAYHLINIESYRSKNNLAGMVTARGCPFRCSFCTISQIAYINREVSSVLDELHFLIKEKSFKHINFADGLFFAQKQRVMNILDAMEEKDIFMTWRGSVRANTFRPYSDQEIARLRAAGLEGIFCGAESGSQAVLDRVLKGVTVEDILDLASLTRKHDIQLTLTFLNGLPYETVDDLNQTNDIVKRIFELNPNTRILNPFFNPLPGSPAYLEMIKTGWEAPKSLEEWGRKTKWGRQPDEIEPFPWLSSDEFKLYMSTYKKSFLYESSLKDSLDKQ